MEKSHLAKYLLNNSYEQIIKDAPKYRSIFLLFFMLLVHCEQLLAQNLVPNASFEVYNNCQNFSVGVPGFPDNIVYSTSYDSFPTVQAWITPLYRNSPDYFNVCDTDLNWHSVPKNNFGYQQPHMGSAYTGICMYVHEHGGFDDYREYLEAKLKQPLAIGHQYYISFFVNLATSHLPILFGNVLSVDKIGVLITDTLVHDTTTFTDAFLTLTPQVESATGKYITDTTNWTKISGTYTAHGGEQWITLGHFKDGVQNDTLMYTTSDSTYSNDSFFYCYMYIDDICVMDVNGNTHDTAYCVSNFPTAVSGSTDIGNYTWNTGDTTSSIQAMQPGTYWRVVRSECLYHTDTILILQQPAILFGRDTTLCSEHSITLGKDMGTMNYRWNTGDTNCCIVVNTTGIYSLTETNNCGSATSSINVTFSPCDNCLVVPNAFTPNHDGVNDVFKAIARCDIKDYQMRIYDRWGQQVYSTSDVTNGWDGTFHGVAQNMDVFYYYIKYTPESVGNNREILLKGSVQLIR